MTNENYDNIKIKVEAILFSYGDWVSVTEIQNILNLDSKLLIDNALKELIEKYKEGYSFGIETNENSKWRMALKPDYEDVVNEIISNVEIPKTVLRVLSVIAYEQPITKTRLLEILGRSVKEEVNWLFKNKFLSYEKKGIGKYYKVTKKFYDYFKLDEKEDFREKANKNITEFLEEVPKSNLEGEIPEEENLDPDEELDDEEEEFINEIVNEELKSEENNEKNSKNNP